MALVSQAIINGQIGNPQQYTNNPEMNIKRGDVFNIISQNKSILNKTNRPFRVRKPNDYLFTGMNKPYSESELKYKINRLDKAIQNGTVYYFDTETLGQPKSVFDDMINNTSIPSKEKEALIKLNSDNHIMTELFMKKQEYKNGIPINDGSDFIKITNGIKADNLGLFEQKIRENPYGGLFQFNLERMAGLGVDGSYLPGDKYPRMFDTNANIDDLNLTARGRRNIANNSMFMAGTQEFKNEAQRIYDMMGNAAMDKNSVFISLNGDKFDMPVLDDYWAQAGVKRNKKFDSAIKNAHLDEQKAISQTIKSTIYKDTISVKNKLQKQFEEAYKKGNIELGEKLEEQYHSIIENDLRITNESIGIAATNRGLERQETQFHNAKDDTKYTQSSLEKYHQDLINSVKKSKDSISNYDDKLFTANSAIIFDKDKDLFFSNTVGDGGNVYNSVGMERGHTYKFNMYDLEDFKTNGATSEETARLEEASKNLKNKKLLEIEDQYEYSDGIKRKSYLVLDSEIDMQEKIMNAGNISIHDVTSFSKDEIKKTTEQAMQDRARRLKDSWYSINSNKGYESFEMNFNTMTEFKKQYPNGTKEDFLKLMNTNATETKSQFKHMFTGGNYNKSMIQERVMDFYNIFDDLNENYDMYSILKQSVENNIGSIDNFKKRNGIAADVDNITVREQYNQAKTATLYETKTNLDNELIKGVSDEDAIKMFYKNNLDVEKNVKLNKALASGENSDVVMKREFKNIFGFEFDKDLDVVRNSILGYKPIEENAVTLSQFDIIAPSDGTYTRISGDNIKEIEEGITNKLNSITAANGSKKAKMTRRNTYIDNVAYDLMNRNLMTRDQLMDLRQSKNPYSKATLIAEMIYNDRQKAEKILTKISSTPNASFGEIISQKNFDFKNPSASSDETRFLKNYIEQMHKSDIMSTDTVEKIGAKYKGEIVKNVIKSNEAINKLGANSILPPVFSGGNITDSQIIQLKNMFEKEYGWDNKKSESFLDATIFNKANDSVEGGVSNMIINSNGQGYLVTSNKKRQKRLMDYLVKNNNNIDIEEIKKYSMVYKLDKIEDINGIKAIRKGKSSAVAVTNDVIARKANKNSPITFELRDTFDQTLVNLKYKYEYGIDALNFNNYEKANSIINSSRRAINDNKRMNGTVVTTVRDETGKVINKTKDIRHSIADYMLKDKYNISEIMGSLDTVLKDQELADSFIKNTSKNELERLKRQIKSYQMNPYDKNKKVLFENQSVGAKMWFGQNSERIAEMLLEDERMQGDGIKTMLKSIKENGAGVLLSKESREASRGYINAIPVHEYVAGGLYSGASRPLINQVLSSKAIVEQDMIDAALKNNILSGDISKITINDLKENLDFKTTRSFITEKSFEFEKQAYKNGDLLSLSTSMKYMSPEDFLNQINNFKTDKDSLSIIAKKHGVSIDDVIKAAEDINASSSIYEDSGAISPKLARLFEDKTVMVEKDVEDIFSFVKNLKNNGKEVIGIDRELNQVTYKNNPKYFDLKIAVGGSEKMVVHTPQINNNKLDLYEDVFKKISGGANIIGDPNYGKHEAFNSMITMYTNAITRSISNDNDMDVANQILKKHFSVDGTVIHDHKIVKDELNGYVLQEGKRLKNSKFNGVKSFKDSIDEMKNLQGSFGTKFNSMIKDIEINKMGYVDIATMSDNTIEKSFRWINGERVGGAKINHRSQQVLGLFIGNDPVDELLKYRDTVNGNVSNPLHAIIEADIKEMIGDDSYIRRMQQSSNVGAALSLNSNFDDELVKKAKIKTLNIDKDIILTSNMMSADEVPEIFSFSRQHGERVNAYKINLGNIKLNNPYITDLKNNAADYAHEVGLDRSVNPDEIIRRFKHKFGLSETINDIYVPSLLPHKVGNDYVLSETQKSAADLITAVGQLKSGEHLGKSRDELLEIANNKLSSYMDSLRYDLTDKNGLFKKGLSIRAENSARLKVANVIAPIADKDGRYVNSLLRNKSTSIMPNGKIKYIGAQFVNPETLFGTVKDIQSSYKNIGKQILNNEIGNADEVAKFLKSNTGIKNDIASLGKKYLEDVGIENIIMRDPAMLTTSYQPIKTYIRDSVTAGTTVFDAVTASLINADGDGDEINVFNHMLKKSKDGGYKMLDRNSDIYVSLNNAIDINSKTNLDRFKNLSSNIMSEEYKSSRDSAKTINGYIKELKLYTKDDVNYITGDSSVNNLLARFLKDSIGQVSNPNYYLKSASTFYHGNTVLNEASLRSQRNIQLLTDITEQSLIDIKSVKGVEQANAVAKLATNYKENMDILGVKSESFTKEILNKKSQLSSMEDMLYQVGSILEDKSINLSGSESKIIKFNKDILTDDKLRTEVAERILKGSYLRGHNGDMNFVSVEEIFGDMFKVLQDDRANSVFWHSSIRQTDVSKMANKSASHISRAKRALESVGIGEKESYRNPLFKASGADNFLLNAPMINDSVLSVGDRIQSTTISKNIDPGLYKVKSVSRGTDGVKVQFEDMTAMPGDNSVSVIKELTGSDFDDISRKISSFDISDKYKTNNQIFNDIEPKIQKSFFDNATQSMHGLDELFSRDNSNNTVANKLASRVKESIHYDNTMDYLTTVEVLKENKLITNDELTIMRKNMNDALKKEGSSSYREVKKAEMLKLKAISSRGVSSGTYNAFMNDVFNDSVMDNAQKNYKYKYASDIVDNNQRYNIDSISDIINNDIESIIKESPELSAGRDEQYRKIIDRFKVKDSESINNIKSLIEESSIDDKMAKEVFNINLKVGVDAISNGDSQKALNMLNKTIITFGDYSGYTIEQLGIEKANMILSDTYMSGIGNDLDNKIIEETRNIVKEVTELSKKNDIIIVSPSDIAKNDIISEFGEDYLSNIRKQLNENIKTKGKSKIRESISEKTTSLKSVLDKAKTGFNELSSGKKAALVSGIAAISALGIAAVSSSGKETMYENKNKYDSKGNIKNVKTTEAGTTSTRHDVPKSNSRFYANQNVGIGVKVKADAPYGASPNHSGNYLSNMFGGSDLNISTSFNDSTTPVNDSDIDNMMSDTTNY